jgi:hypothetical protein
MAPIALALFLFLQGQPAVTEPSALAADAAPPAEAAETPPQDRFPAGAPHDDYLFVAWCYGSLRAYIDLHDRVMPEVTRIETTFRPPGRKLSDDLKVYADMQKEGRAQLKTFQGALTAAEKASLRPINILGGQAVSKGRDVWKAGPDVTPARLAQAWMSWVLPARCETTAKTLHDKAVLMGASFKVNDEPDAQPSAADAAPAEAAPEAAPPAPSIDSLLPPTSPPAQPPAPEPAAAPPETPPAPSPSRN